MAFLTCSIKSNVLQMDTNINVILPYDRPSENQQTPCKVLYLLHGLSDNSTCWTRYTAVERYAREEGFAIIMPEVQRSLYADMEYGLKYFTYVSQELPDICEQMFRISSKREDTFVAGLSMGGYGALKCAFSFPDRYAGCASFSGAVDLDSLRFQLEDESLRKEFMAVMGMELELKSENNLVTLAEELSELPASQHPQIFITCGKQDFLYQDNLKYKDILKKLSIDFTFSEWEGTHEWSFWDTSVKMAIPFFVGKDF